jgi:hypothetical protein
MTDINFDLTEEEILRRAGFYATVGQAISLWADNETNIVRIFGELLGIEEEKAGLILFSMNFLAWLPLITELFKTHPKHHRKAKKWNKLAERLRSLNDLRTRLAHHTTWESEPGNMVLKASRLDTRPRTKTFLPLTESDIHSDFTQKLYLIDEALYELLFSLKEIPFPKKSASSKGGQHPSGAR